MKLRKNTNLLGLPAICSNIAKDDQTFLQLSNKKNGAKWVARVVVCKRAKIASDARRGQCGNQQVAQKEPRFW